MAEGIWNGPSGRNEKEKAKSYPATAPTIAYPRYPSIACVWLCAAFSIEIARLRRSKARKNLRENAQTCGKIYLIFGAQPTQNSAGTHRVCCVTYTTAARLAAESALYFVLRLRDFGVRKRAKFREKTRESLTQIFNFV